MPFTSQAQWKLFGHKVATGEISKEKFKEWRAESPSYSKLPARKGKKKGKKGKHGPPIPH